MSKYKRNGKWTIRVPHPESGVVEKAIGTGNSTVAGNYETMCDMFLSRPQDHVFLYAVCQNRLKIRTLYAHWVNKTLDALRTQLADLNLAPYLAPWRAMLVRDFGEPTKAEHTARKYPDQVQAFFGWVGGRERPRKAPPIWISTAPLSSLTPANVSLWMATRDVESSTHLRYWAALKAFIAFLESISVLDADPLIKLKAPAANDARTRYLTPDEQERLIEAAPEGPVRTAEVLAHMGLERSAILATRARDVDLKARTLFAHGTKHVRGRQNYRSRVTDIPTWALPYLKKALRFAHPNTLLVPLHESKLRRGHEAACEAAGITGYRLHDGRHTYAVYMRQAGAPDDTIGQQLGHKDGQQVARVYGRYKPKPAELAHWRDVAERHHRAVR